LGNNIVISEIAVFDAGISEAGSYCLGEG